MTLGGYLVAVDPGTEEAGIACFTAGRLIFADVVKDKTNRKLTQRAFSVGWELVRLLESDVPQLFRDPSAAAKTKIILEYPRVLKYGPAAKADPDDILALALVLGGFGALMLERGFLIPGMVRPAAWKGQVKKRSMTLRIIACLSPEERLLLGKKPNHNAVDAVGLGMDELGRLPMAGEVIQ